MPEFILTRRAKKKFFKLPKEVQARISKKFDILEYHPNIFSIIKKLEEGESIKYILRIGSHRLLLFRKSNDVFLVVDLGPRDEIYK